VLIRIIKPYYDKGDQVLPSSEPVDKPKDEAVRLIEGRVAVPVREIPAERAVAPPAPERTASLPAPEPAAEPDHEPETTAPMPKPKRGRRGGRRK
jgi:hypothetical protein